MEFLMSKDKFWIAFSSIEDIDSKFVQRLYNYFGDIEKAFNSTMHDLSQIEDLNIKKCENFLRIRDKINPEQKLSEITNRGISFFTFEDENYPYLLKNIYNPPMVLYYKGNIEQINLEKTIAVVGSRRATTASKEVLAKIISELSGTDACIVSGLAAGIDTTAHKSAIENGLKTIGVIASGFDYTYPNANKDLYKEIETGSGSIVIEYFPSFQPLKFRFPQRNRIVSGLSAGTLVAEAALKSGALITANLCLEQGRELMCIPGLVSNPNTKGIYKLLKNGATMVTEANDILTALDWEIIKNKQLELNLDNFNENEQKVINSIEIEPKGFDIISSETNISPEELLSIITN